MKKIKPEQLSDEIMKMLDEYKDAADRDVESSVQTVSKTTKKMIQAASPRRHGGYSKGWSVKREQNNRGKHSVVIYNRKKPGLTHLLENVAAAEWLAGCISHQQKLMPFRRSKQKSEGGYPYDV